MALVALLRLYALTFPMKFPRKFTGLVTVESDLQPRGLFRDGHVAKRRSECVA